MLDLRAPALPVERGERLSREAYRRDFREREQAIRGGDSWKLERLQHFEEVGSPSREALRRGDWQEALRLMAGRADALRAEALDDERRGAAFHRLRVVEEPLTPYLQWELHSLRQQAQFGHLVRVVPADVLAPAESDTPLPELVVLDDRTLYRVLYSPNGAPAGAMRWTDPSVVKPWASYIRGAYALGEDVLTYFDRVVAPLPPPPAA
ncbi:DUF6879 family protein [Actinacidiphila paucisporea]|uniref:DUF6879 domain-containing protein n=1 Tax=Actinacidiphila paucisporea TaxID=310782 RepID=A0A1M6VCI1_9ACTN|nr:DUF6879 family protein [Actinacidiphila paucisporea]SHK79180.1 hypothetical protein SAMN05216499_101645 [Actinacidiphila paucisporea]